MGGPIIKDKLFFFVNYDGQRRSFPIIYTGPSNTLTNPLYPPQIARLPLFRGLPRRSAAAAVNYVLGNIGPHPDSAIRISILANSTIKSARITT